MKIKKVQHAAIAILLLAMLSSCISVFDSSYKTLALTKVSAEGIAKTAKTLHTQRILSDEDISKIRHIYEKARIANDAVIDAMITAIDNGIRPETSEDYLINIAVYNNILIELMDKAKELNIIKE